MTSYFANYIKTELLIAKMYKAMICLDNPANAVNVFIRADFLTPFKEVHPKATADLCL